MFFIDFESPRLDGESYEQLLNLCFQWSNYFSFSTLNLPNKDDTMQTELIPYIRKEIITSYWFNYMTLPDNPIRRILYTASAESMSILKKYCHRIFLFDSKGFGWNQTLEDLCFFSNDELLLGTVSHEFICEVFPPDKAFETRLLEIYSHWRLDDDFTE